MRFTLMGNLPRTTIGDVMAQKAILEVVEGPNKGDSIAVEHGVCRLVGRHLSEAETVMIGRDGNRVLDGAACDIVSGHLHGKAPNMGASSQGDYSTTAFERGADIVFADDSISRAHAMVFLDDSGFGVIDLASTNGTFVNSTRVQSAHLEVGHVLEVGKSQMVIELQD
jgi:hypothetical protein